MGHRLGIEDVDDDGVAPIARSSPSFDAVRVVPATACPFATSFGTSWRPMTPVAPAMRTFMGLPCVVRVHEG